MKQEITPELDEWLKHERYHSPLKGCKLVPEVITREGGGTVRSYFCEQCGVECSKGGWEWGWFGGTLSKDLKD